MSTVLLISFSILTGQTIPQIIVKVVVPTMVAAKGEIMGTDPIPFEAAQLQGSSGLSMIHAKGIKSTTILII